MEDIFKIYIEQVDPATNKFVKGKTVAHLEDEKYAANIAILLSQIDNGGDGSRQYKYAKLENK